MKTLQDLALRAEISDKSVSLLRGQVFVRVVTDTGTGEMRATVEIAQ